MKKGNPKLFLFGLIGMLVSLVLFFGFEFSDPIKLGLASLSMPFGFMVTRYAPFEKFYKGKVK